MNKIEYVLDQKLLQRILDYIGGSSTDLKVIQIINLVDDLRNLKPFDPNTQKVPNEHLLAVNPKE
jgi:hypothetical protein